MSEISNKISGFTLNHVDLESKTQRLLTSALKRANICTSCQPQSLFWDANYFGLNQVKYFCSATPQQQQQILQFANKDLLEEIYWVEQAGVGYMAKMVILAQTHEERLLYSLFSADEATHLATITPFLKEVPVFSGDTFLSYMAKAIESDDKLLLMVLVQVVLEGWGMGHYRSLAKYCLNPHLGEILQGFLDAEARHHALGVTLVKNSTDYCQESLGNIYSALTYFLHMVQVGPQRLLINIERILGYLSANDKVKILTELETEKHSSKKLELLRSLLVGTLPDSIIESLEKQGSFHPYSPSQCIR
ncbi:ferritin-like domain-containing protein [Cyanobacterium aponinum]|uniref:Ferritin-like domain-containing protein n=1 Tax=Cyanobacterium aponinum 0216 TaxID=2676140 RepID=A0A844GSH2_9CHRO|nr:ferritin-like domain-containing protein [Cyanobacterium aponinum]MTF39437.1 ferritin-like domain-containing protein [Cyanobacterium aponinum 0216]